MQVAIVFPTSLGRAEFAPLISRLGECFGRGDPGWLSRDVPGETVFDLAEGKVSGPGGIFIRSAASGLWARAH